jgi:integrase
MTRFVTQARYARPVAKTGSSRSARQKGSIDTLPSGARRVRVYAGVDPVTKRRHDLIEVVPPGPQADKIARATRDRLVNEVAERRNPRTNATVDQLLARYLDQFDGAPNTLTLYRGYVRNHLSPFLGRVKVGQLDAEMLDAFYAELRRCRVHCNGRRSIEHRTSDTHECDDKCVPHVCRPLGPTTVRHMHFILSGAYKRAVRWRWVSVSPMGQAEPPAAPKANPQPPTPADAARILNAAWRDPDWGALLWTAMTTGARRGELCAVRWSSVNLDDGRQTLWLRRAIRKEGGRLVEAELKTHQQRRIALDAETVAVLREHRERCEERAAALGVALSADAFVFSGAPDGSTFPTPDTVTQRYERLAGRLGHGGGGVTTLRTYTAWVSEADQRAATGLGAGMPQRPTAVDPDPRTSAEPPRSPYEVIAADLSARIKRGELATGMPAPTAQELATRHEVAVSTARRAVTLAKEWGLLVNDGHGRPRVAAVAPVAASPSRVPAGTEGTQFWSVTVRGVDGALSAPRMVRASLSDPESFRRHLVGIARAEWPSLTRSRETEWIGEHEIDVRAPGTDIAVAILRWG